MVLVLDGNSDIGAHVQREIGNLFRLSAAANMFRKVTI